MLSNTVLLHHADAHPYALAAKVVEAMQQLRSERLPNLHPHYSPDSSPCGLRVFGAFREVVSGFTFGAEVKEAVLAWIRKK